LIYLAIVVIKGGLLDVVLVVAKRVFCANFLLLEEVGVFGRLSLWLTGNLVRLLVIFVDLRVVV
jgi:hypothetical protein